jgi:hypothetical protein
MTLPEKHLPCERLPEESAPQLCSLRLNQRVQAAGRNRARKP